MIGSILSQFREDVARARRRCEATGEGKTRASSHLIRSPCTEHGEPRRFGQWSWRARGLHRLPRFTPLRDGPIVPAREFTICPQVDEHPVGSHNDLRCHIGRRRNPSESVNAMTIPSSPNAGHWLPAFDKLLDTVRGCGPHGQLVDIRELLRPVVGPGRPLVILCPHADDGAITAACLLHEYAVRRGLPVIEVLVFAGERNVAAPWLNNQKKATVREAEFRLECSVLGAESVFWDLEAYRMPGYLPTASDVEKVVGWFETRRPGAVIVPPANDAHVAHRVTRALAAIGMVGAPERLPRTDRLDTLGTPSRTQRLSHVRRRGRTHQGMGHPLPCLAGVLD